MHDDMDEVDGADDTRATTADDVAPGGAGQGHTRRRPTAPKGTAKATPRARPRAGTAKATSGKATSGKERRGRARRLGTQPLSDEAQASIRRLLYGGGRVFSANGYHAASVDQIVAESKLARGTFYKYFDDKLDLLVTLAEECASHMHDLSAAFARIEPGPGCGAALRGWCTDFLEVHERYAGVFRVWSEETPRHEVLDRTGHEVVREAVAAFRAVFDRVDRPYALDVRAASVMVLGLIERFPYQAAGSNHQQPPEQLVETMAAFVERGLLNGVPRATRAR
jgi:AcrR family transcriptional regulator